MADRPQSPYDVLGLDAGAAPAEVRQAYLKLARRFHPDAHAGRSPAERAHAERRMRDVNAAWSELSDPARRRRLEQRAATERTERQPPAGHGWRPLASDDAWMDDFAAWRDDTDVLGPDPDPPGPDRPIRLLPVAFLLVGLACGLVGVVLDARPLLAAGFIGLALAGVLFLWLPFAELARTRHSDPDR